MNDNERFNGRRPLGRRDYFGFATGWQVAVGDIDSLTRGWRERMAPRQYAETILQASIRLDRERRSPHVARWLEEDLEEKAA